MDNYTWMTKYLDREQLAYILANIAECFVPTDICSEGSHCSSCSVDDCGSFKCLIKSFLEWLNSDTLGDGVSLRRFMEFDDFFKQLKGKDNEVC